jgi:hypothetical protein
MDSNNYLMYDIHLYKIINKLKNGVEVVEVPIKHQEKKQIDEIIGSLEIQYNTNIDTNTLQKMKLTNKEIKNVSYKFDEKDIINNKFIFETITIDTLNETYYNCNNMICV